MQATSVALRPLQASRSTGSHRTTRAGHCGRRHESAPRSRSERSLAGTSVVSTPMADAITVDRRTLVTQAWRSYRLLYLRTPVLLERGQTYWVDLDTDSLVVQDVAGRQQSFPGHYGDPAEQPRG